MNIYITGLDLTKASRVLFTSTDDISNEDVIAIQRKLAEYFPHCKFVFLSGFYPVSITEDPSYIEITELDD